MWPRLKTKFLIIAKMKNNFFKKAVSFAELSLGEGDKSSTVQILRTGSWSHATYGKFSIKTEDLDIFVANFHNNVRGVALCVDENHDDEHKALGWFRDVYREGEALFAVIDWTEKGAEMIRS